MKISVVVCTARRDYPFTGRPTLHVFDPVIQTLLGQTFKDFELILVDALWETRKWTVPAGLPFTVKHVPASPNRWHAIGYPGLNAQFNRGIAWSDGDLIWTGFESNMYPPTFLEQAWRSYQSGFIPVAWYLIAGGEHRPHEALAPYYHHDFNLLGYTDGDVTGVDHRGSRFALSGVESTPCHHAHYFGYSAVPRGVAEQVNGFDEALDSDVQCADFDMGYRIVHAVGDRLRMHRDLYVVEPPVEVVWNAGISRKPVLKCSYAQYLYNRVTNRRVNTPMPTGWVETITEIVCQDVCEVAEECRAKNDFYPLCGGPDRAMVDFWLSGIPVFELRDERAKRLTGAYPYDRITEQRP